MSPNPVTLHAGCILVGTHGLLIRGESGSGKSYLARLILDHCAAHRRFAAMVADDQVHVYRHETPQGAYLTARPVQNIKGLMEVRGLGLVRIAHEEAAVLGAVLDLTGISASGKQPDRFPHENVCKTCVLGVTLPRLEATNVHMALDLLLSVLNLGNENSDPFHTRHTINEAFPLAFKPQYGNDRHS